ncbi:hypothetical protein TNCV_4619721 [Trichonephila clavipes]|nr:hypothetical protein TNCV_4619721 [Trichonephila clavipes]
MPVVSDPCSCQSDCLVCGRGDEPSHDCAFRLLVGIDGVSRTNVARRTHRSQSGGNFETWQRISTPLPC